MTKKEKLCRADEVVSILETQYPEAVCSLNYETPFQLLIATRLSAQCTDLRVNIVTPALFARFPDAEKMAKASVEEVELLIKTCGLYKTKAKDLVGIGQAIVEKFDGKVPDTIEQLTSMPGVGRKTANLVCGDVFGKPAIVTDTHFIRICNRLQLVKGENPVYVETEMRKIINPLKSNDFCHRVVMFGREFCTAKNPKCDVCPLTNVCKKNLRKGRLL